MASQGLVAAPNPVPLASHFASDVDEAEQATLSKPIGQFKAATIRTLFSEKRTLSNSSSASSNAATLVDKEHDEEELSPTQKPADSKRRKRLVSNLILKPVLGDPSIDTAYTRLKRLVSTINFTKSRPQATEAFVGEQCKNNSLQHQPL